MSLIFLLLTAIHIHSISAGYREVTIMACDGKYASIYADKKMTLPLPNPMLSNADGSYEFYSPSTCLDIKEWK